MRLPLSRRTSPDIRNTPAKMRSILRGKGRRFNVRSCVRWLEAVGLDESFNLDALPSPHQFNEMHRDLRKRLIEKAMTISQFELSDGQAAKIINCYLKARFINAQTAHLDKVHSIHPPIDRLLLDELIRIADLDGAQKQKLKAAKDRGWSALGADEYEAIIAVLQDLSDGEPLWSIERYWRGFQ